MRIKSFALLLICLLLCSCVDERKADVEHITESQKEEVIQNTFEDLSGTERKLKIDYVHEKDVGVKLDFFNYATNYSQVDDGHYYYMRQIGENIFAIYQDKGKELGRFQIKGKNKNLQGCVKYNSQFYVRIYVDTLEGDLTRLARVDFQNQTVDTICDIVINGNIEEGVDGIVFYDDAIYLWNGFKMQVDKLDMKGEILETFSFPETADNEYNMDFINIFGGKIYYANMKYKGKREVIIRCLDMENGVVEQVLCYTFQEDKSGGAFVQNNLMIMQENIFAFDSYEKGSHIYSILPEDEKMKEIANGLLVDFTYNSTYYFYIDKKNNIHRLNRKTQEDKIISNIKAVGIDCTETGLYVKEYSEWFHMVGEEGCPYIDYANSLYFMDFEGTNVEEFMNGKKGNIEW